MFFQQFVYFWNKPEVEVFFHFEDTEGLRGFTLGVPPNQTSLIGVTLEPFDGPLLNLHSGNQRDRYNVRSFFYFVNRCKVIIILWY